MHHPIDPKVDCVFPDVPGYAHDIALRDADGRAFGASGGIRLLEIAKFAAAAVQTEQERWVKFFKEGATLDPDHLPPWMDTPEMRQAMTTMNMFSEKERAYHAYQARLEYQRVQNAMAQDMEERTQALAQARAELEQAQATAEQARAAEEQARAAADQARAAAEQARAAADQARAAEEQARATAEDERAAKARALAEVERLRAELDRRRDA
jgi:hypothetical protein